MVGLEKNKSAPLICAALSQPVEEVNALKPESVAIDETVSPVMGAAEFSNEPLLKLKMASVAEWDARDKDRERAPILKNGEVVMDVVRGGVRDAMRGAA